MRVILSKPVNQNGLKPNRLQKEIQFSYDSTFKGSEKSEKAKNIAKRLFKTTKPEDWREPFLKKWFDFGKETRVYEDKQYGKVIVELSPIIKNHVAKKPIYISNFKAISFGMADYQPTTARMIIASEGIDISTQEHHHPVMQLALDVIQHETSSSSIDGWF